MAWSIVVIGPPARKKALFASLRRRMVREASFAITAERSVTEILSSEASLTSLIATGDRAGSEYPSAILSSILASESSISEK